MKITSMDQLTHGLRVRGMIHNKRFEDGMVSFTGSGVYVCQNVMYGSRSSNLMGFKWSWSVFSNTQFDHELTLETIDSDAPSTPAEKTPALPTPQVPCGGAVPSAVVARDDGGAAFPYGQVSEQTGQPINGFFERGMTLRDWLAGTATDADVAFYLGDDVGSRAVARYLHADSMLKVRAM